MTIGTFQNGYNKAARLANHRVLLETQHGTAPARDYPAVL